MPFAADAAAIADFADARRRRHTLLSGDTFRCRHAAALPMSIRLRRRLRQRTAIYARR